MDRRGTRHLSIGSGLPEPTARESCLLLPPSAPSGVCVVLPPPHPPTSIPFGSCMAAPVASRVWEEGCRNKATHSRCPQRSWLQPFAEVFVEPSRLLHKEPLYYLWSRGSCSVCVFSQKTLNWLWLTFLPAPPAARVQEGVPMGHSRPWSPARRARPQTVA